MKRTFSKAMVLLFACTSLAMAQQQKGETQQEAQVPDIGNKTITGQTVSGTSQIKSSELSPLIEAVELAGLIKTNTKGLRVLEPGRKSSDFDSGHVPTATFIHWVDDMTDTEEVESYKNPNEEQFANLMCRLGIKASDRIVIYDRLSSRLSTRLFWMLKYFGHEHVQILDGGAEAWKSKFKLTVEKTEFAKSNYETGALQTQILAEMQFVKQNLEDPKTRLIDGRPVKQFSGAVAGKVFHTKKEHPRLGHIPNASNVFWKSNFSEDGTFKSVEELTKLYEGAGIQPDHRVITYCNEGLHAAPPWFVLTQILGYKNVRLYDNSMAEWAKSDAPMAKEK